MRRIQNIFLLFTILATISCVGQKEIAKAYNVTISASQPNISVESGESVKLSVKNLSIDVTEQAEIYYTANGEEVAVEGGSFTATESGEYTFSARFEGVEAEGHAVIRAYDADELSTDFYRRNLVMKFTATWCANCPKMGVAITEAEHALPNRIVEMAVHSNDQLDVEDGNQLAKAYKIISYPTALIDLNGSTTTQSKTEIESLISSSIETNPTSSGIRVSSSLSGSDLEVEVGVKSTTDTSYKVAVALVVDNYHYTQSGAGDPNYKQNKVLKFYLSDVNGDDTGALTANGEEFTKIYNTTLPSEALTSEARVIAYVLSEVDGKYIVNNATECVIGESIDYMYEIK